MKQLYVLLILNLLFVVGCVSYYNVIRSFPDEIKANEKLILYQLTLPNERPIGIRSADWIFLKELNSVGNSVSVFCILHRDRTSFPIEPTGFLKTDGSIFEISTTDKQSFNLAFQGSSSSSMTTIDSTGQTTSTMTTPVFDSWVDDKFKLVLTSEMLKELSKTQTILFRFYSGSLPVSFQFSEKNRLKLQALLAR